MSRASLHGAAARNAPAAITPRDIRTALLSALAVLLLLAALMPATSLWDRDETFYARTAIEMMDSGNYLVPTFNGETFAHKPPLSYWLMAGSMSLLGQSEFAARLPSAFGMAAAAFVTFLIGARMFGPRTGLWSLAIVSSAAMSVYLGSAAMLDTWLLFFTTLAIWAFVEVLYAPRRLPVMALVFAAAIALAMLTKGPVGPAVVATTMVLTTALLPRGEWPGLGALVTLFLAAVVGLGVFLLWAIPANTASGGAMLEQGIGLHVIGRALAPMEGHGGSGVSGYLATLPVYVPVIILGLYPWMIHLPATVSALLRREFGTRRERAILWGWAVPTFVMFTLAATKLPHYVFPLFPALAIAVAATIETKLGAASRWWATLSGWLFGLFAVAAGGGMVAAALAFPDMLPPVRITLIAVVLVALGLAVARLQVRRALRKASTALLAASVVFYGLLFWAIVPGVEPTVKNSAELAELVRKHMAPGVPVFMKGFEEPSLVYYLNLPASQSIRVVPDGDAAARALFNATPKFLLVADEATLVRLSPLAGPDGLAALERLTTTNLNNNAQRQTLVVAGRGLGDAAP